MRACEPTTSLFLAGVAHPVVVVAVLPAALGVDAGHGDGVGAGQVGRVEAAADPAEGAVAPVEAERAHDVLHVRRVDEALLGVGAVGRHLVDAGLEHRLEEAVAVVPEVGAPAAP